MRNALIMACSLIWLLATSGSTSAQFRPSATPAAPPTPAAPGTPAAPATPATPPTAVAPPTPGAEPTPGDESTPAAQAPAGVLESEAGCRAAWKAYLDSLACFAPYRHSAHVIDVEAFKHCKVVKEPDCPQP